MSRRQAIWRINLGTLVAAAWPGAGLRMVLSALARHYGVSKDEAAANLYANASPLARRMMRQHGIAP